jgi:hypothetical protein
MADTDKIARYRRLSCGIWSPADEGNNRRSPSQGKSEDELAEFVPKQQAAKKFVGGNV